MLSRFEEKINKPVWLGLGAVLAAIAASACCIGPLILLSLGIGGAWMSTLTSMESIRPFFLVVTLAFITLAFRKVYRVPKACETEQSCSLTSIERTRRIIFWIGSIILLGLLAFPWVAPWFLG